MTADRILVVAGDPSGDERAAEVIRELRSMQPDLQFFGIGGHHMELAGVQLLYRLPDVQVFGFLEALTNYFRLKSIFNAILDAYFDMEARLALHVDFAGFNLRLAEALKARGGRSCYYIAPQVWATRPRRAEKLATSVERLAVLFEFEVELYQEYGFKADHVGHPLLDSIPDQPVVQSDNRHFPVITVLPGSRSAELRRHLPVLHRSMARLRRRHTDLEAIIIAAPDFEEELQEQFSEPWARVVPASEKIAAISDADAVVVASGTAALEVALLGKPAVVIYKTSAVTAFLARRMLTTDYVSLPNILADAEVYPELLQNECKPDSIEAAINDILADSNRYDRIAAHLTAVRAQLGAPGAAGRVAHLITRMLADSG